MQGSIQTAAAVAEPAPSLQAQLWRAAIPLAAIVVIICGAPWAARWLFPPVKYPGGLRAFAQFYLILHLAPLFVFFASYLFVPVGVEVYRRLHARSHFGYSIAAIAGSCAFFTAFIFHFGNRQFGGFDFSNLVDTGWRVASGQRPYIDFVCTPPPCFYLGLKYAFECFGVNWNAQVWATAIFACATFVWIFWLLSAFLPTRLAALFVAFVIECAAILIADFWWFNNVTAVIAAIFFLSCLIYIERRGDVQSAASYFVSLALLGTTKPNTAGLLAAGGILLLLRAVPRKSRLAALTIAAIASTTAFLTLNDVSIPGMIVSYIHAASWPGRLTVGFRPWRPFAILVFAISVFALAAPPWLLRTRRTALREAESHVLTHELLFALALLVSIVAMFTNSSIMTVEWTVLIAAGSAILFRSASAGRLRQFYIALLITLVFSDLYLAAMRYPVYRSGPHMYFEWIDSRQHIGQPFFRDLTASTRFKNVVEQVGQTVKANPGPFFFGPRMEFSYAVFGLPSPLHWPAWWDPGTSFARSQETSLLSAWRAGHFATLIFLKNDFTYYSPRFLQLINRNYVRDDSRSELTIFHARTLPTHMK